MKFQTRAVSTNIKQSTHGETTPAIYQSVAFAYEDGEQLGDVFEGRQYGHIYSRISNPSVTSLEQRLTQLELARGSVALASGMAALHALVLSLVKPGESLVASTSLFGGTYLLFRDVIEPLNISIKYVDPLDVDAIESAIDETTRFVFVESIGNPKLDVPNLEAISAVTKKAGVPFVLDSTLVSPYILQAKNFGVDIVVSSATKYMGPSGTTVGGYIADLGNFKWASSKSEGVLEAAKKAGDFGFILHLRQKIVTNIGSLLSPFNAYMFSIGIETLALRMEQHSASALKLAQFLEGHSAITDVNYPGLAKNPSHQVAQKQFDGKYGGLLTLCLGSKDKAFAFLKALKLCKNMTNIGDARTLLIHPASTLYKDLSVDDLAGAGVSDDMIRVSVGLEHVDDIIADFEQALAQV